MANVPCPIWFTDRQDASANRRPPIGDSDHNSIYLLPACRQKLKQGKSQNKTIKCWSSDGIDKLKACFDITDWQVLRDSCSSLDDLVDTVSCYIRFCEDLCIDSKTITIYPNLRLLEI